MDAIPAPIALSRRAFIAGAAAVGATAWLASPFGFGEAPNTLARLAASDLPRLSLGFLADRTTLPLERGVRSVPAAEAFRVPLGLEDGAATVHVRGLTPVLDPEMLPAAVDLDALFALPVRGIDAPVPFHAWQRRAASSSMSSPTRFTVGVGPQPSVGFATTVDAGVGHAFLGARQGSGVLPLRSGLYLLGLAPGMWDAPVRLPAADDPAWGELASLVIAITPTGPLEPR